MSGLLPTDYAELDRTMCELDELLQAPRLRRQLRRAECGMRNEFAPGRDVSSAPFPTATSLAPDPVSPFGSASSDQEFGAHIPTSRGDLAEPSICPWCVLERAMSRCSKTERTGLVRVQSCERHAPVESRLDGVSPHRPGFPSEVSCPAESPLTPAGAVDSRRPLLAERIHSSAS